MPLSEDEYDSQSGFNSETGNAQNLSKAELRKTNKPIMEKKRRARINHCLNELKDLLLDAMNKDPARHSKLEKADILELTVKHLQAIQRQQLAAAVASDPAVLHRFRSGFGDCATEVRRYLSRLAPPTPPGLRTRLASHLNTCLNGIERTAPEDFPKFHETIELDLPEKEKLELSKREDKSTRFDVRDYNARIGLKLENRLPKAGTERSSIDDRKSELRFEDRKQSAFRYVRRPSSPPLSPISCDSACDSSTEPETPPRPQITSIPQITYPTPPSRSASDQDSSPETQKPTVSSTTISPESRAQQTALDLKSKRYTEPLSIVIDVENYKIGIDASPKRPVDYRHKLKRTSHSQIERSSKVPKLDIPSAPYKVVVEPVEKPIVSRSVISHTAASLAESSVNDRSDSTAPEKPAQEENAEADSSRSPEQKAHSSGDAMWRPW